MKIKELPSLTNSLFEAEKWSPEVKKYLDSKDWITAADIANFKKLLVKAKSLHHENKDREASDIFFEVAGKLEGMKWQSGNLTWVLDAGDDTNPGDDYEFVSFSIAGYDATSENTGSIKENYHLRVDELIDYLSHLKPENKVTKAPVTRAPRAKKGNTVLAQLRSEVMKFFKEQYIEQFASTRSFTPCDPLNNDDEPMTDAIASEVFTAWLMGRGLEFWELTDLFTVDGFDAEEVESFKKIVAKLLTTK